MTRQWDATYKADRLVDLTVLDSASYASLGRRDHLYCIQMDDDGPVKVGVAADVTNRLHALQTANPYPLHVRASFDGLGLVERTLHGILATDRLSGEWFQPTERVAGLIAGSFPMDVLDRFVLKAGKPWRHVTRRDLTIIESAYPAARACARWRLAMDWWLSELRSRSTVEDFFAQPVDVGVVA